MGSSRMSKSRTFLTNLRLLSSQIIELSDLYRRLSDLNLKTTLLIRDQNRLEAHLDALHSKVWGPPSDLSAPKPNETVAGEPKTETDTTPICESTESEIRADDYGRSIPLTLDMLAEPPPFNYVKFAEGGEPLPPHHPVNDPHQKYHKYGCAYYAGCDGPSWKPDKTDCDCGFYQPCPTCGQLR